MSEHMIFQRLEDRERTRVVVKMFIESGCDPKTGEYELYLVSSSLPLDIFRIGGVDDVSKIKECIENEVGEMQLPEEGMAEIHLIESGEWEDVFWNKYYVVEKIEITNFAKDLEPAI